jgi:hypothetical protein
MPFRLFPGKNAQYRCPQFRSSLYPSFRQLNIGYPFFFIRIRKIIPYARSADVQSKQKSLLFEFIDKGSIRNFRISGEKVPRGINRIKI